MTQTPRPDPEISRAVEFQALVDPEVQTSRVEARRITMSAGFVAGRHVHNGPVVGSVVRGTVSFQVAGEPATLLRPGDVFFEPAGRPIECFDAGEEDVEFVAFFLLGQGETPEIVFPG